MRTFILAILLGTVTTASSDPIFKIEVGENYQDYSQSDLKKRVFELERAVWQLQQQVFQMQGENKPIAAAATVDSVICTIDAMGSSYPGTGPNKAVAMAESIKACKAGRGGDGFFCKNPRCE